MKITFDPGKDIRNRAKHGISLAEAKSIDWGRALSGWTSASTTEKREFVRWLPLEDEFSLCCL
jgi:uncharacterized DUF497 family protein